MNITAGKTNLLSYLIWLTELDLAHAQSILSPTTSQVTVSTPLLPGLQLGRVLPLGTMRAIIEGSGIAPSEWVK